MSNSLVADLRSGILTKVEYTHLNADRETISLIVGEGSDATHVNLDLSDIEILENQIALAKAKLLADTQNVTLRLARKVATIHQHSDIGEIGAVFRMIAKAAQEKKIVQDDILLTVSKMCDRLKWPMPAIQYAIAKAQEELGYHKI